MVYFVCLLLHVSPFPIICLPPSFISLQPTLHPNSNLSSLSSIALINSNKVELERIIKVKSSSFFFLNRLCCCRLRCCLHSILCFTGNFSCRFLCSFPFLFSLLSLQFLTLLFNFSKTLKQSLDQVPFQIFLSPSLLTYVIDDGAE
jgi:hypothetical protein